MRRFAYSLILLAISTGISFSQNIGFKVSAPNSVRSGEKFEVQYSINREARGIFINSFGDFRVVSGPTQALSRSITVINGEMKKESKTIFTYVLEAYQTGKLLLPMATVETDSLKCVSDSLLIDVLEKSETTAPRDSSTAENVFIELTFSKEEVYLQEPVCATLKLYSKVSVGEIEEVSLPAFDTFIAYNIDTLSEISLKEEIKNGEKYYSAIVARVLLCPHFAGEIPLSGARVKCTLRKPKEKVASKNPFDDFFDTGYVLEDKTIESDPKIIYVKNFPEASGIESPEICGTNMRLSVSVDRSEIYKNKPFIYEIRLSGSGNLKTVLTPRVSLANGLILKSTEETNNLKTTEEGISGDRTFSYTILPEEQGEFIIPPVSITYFDLDSLKTRTISTLSTIAAVKNGTDARVIEKAGRTGNDKSLKKRSDKNEIIIALDVSASMLAQDLKPDRLTSAIKSTEEFVKSQKGQMGLVLFSESAVIKCPLGSAKTEIMDSLKSASKVKLGNGTATGMALGLAVSEINKGKSEKKSVILLTDGNTNSGTITGNMAARLAEAYGIDIYVIGICGKDSTALYPVDTPTGRQMMAMPVTIDEEELTGISGITNGRYYRAYDSISFASSYKEITGQLKKKHKKTVEAGSEKDAQRILYVLKQDLVEIEHRINEKNEDEK